MKIEHHYNSLRDLAKEYNYDIYYENGMCFLAKDKIEKDFSVVFYIRNKDEYIINVLREPEHFTDIEMAIRRFRKLTNH